MRWKSRHASASPALHQINPPRRWQAGSLIYTTGGLCALFFWLLWGDFAWNVKERSVLPVLQLLLKNFHSSDTTLTILITVLPCALNLCVTPVVSFRSDRHRGRWGRRIPYLVIFTPITVVAMVGLAFSPALAARLTASGLFSSLEPDTATVALLGVFWVMFEFASLSAVAVFNALINDVVPHPLLGRFYGLFRALSLIVGIVFSYTLFGKAEAYYRWIFLGLGALYGFGFLSMCLKVKEGAYPPVAPAGTSAKPSLVTSVREYFQECFTHRYYRWLFVALTLCTLAFLPFGTFSLFYAKSLAIDMGTYGNYVAISYAISLVLAPAIGWVADRFHPLRLTILICLVYAPLSLACGLFATNERWFLIAFVLNTVLGGVWWTTLLPLQQRLFPRSNFAQFASAVLFFQSLCQILLGLGLGILLDHIGHLYRVTFFIGMILSGLALLAVLQVYRWYQRLGGDEAYIAPLSAGPVQR